MQKIQQQDSSVFGALVISANGFPAVVFLALADDWLRNV